MSSEPEIYPYSSFHDTLKKDAPTSQLILEMTPTADGKYWIYQANKGTYRKSRSHISPSRDMRSRHEAAATEFSRRLTKAELSFWNTPEELDIEISIEARDFSCRMGRASVFPPKSHLWPEITQYRRGVPYVIVTVGDVSRWDTVKKYLPLPSSRSSNSEGKSRETDRRDDTDAHRQSRTRSTN